MVTTIKITCDGVFIQSNPYFTNANPRHSPVVVAHSDTDGSSLSSSMSSYSSTTTDVSDDLQHRNAAIRAEDATEPTIVEESGNMTVVMRNNRKKIGGGRSMRNSLGEHQGGDCDKSLGIVEAATGGLLKQSCRPSYHYMYMVRKVPANRAPLLALTSGNAVLERRPRTVAANGVTGDAVNEEDAAAISSHGGATSVADDLRAVDDDDNDNDRWRRSEGEEAEEMQQPVVDVDAAAAAVEPAPVVVVGHSDSDAELERHNYPVDTLTSRYTRQQNLIASADFENWYLRKRDDQDSGIATSDISSLRSLWADQHVESRLLTGSCEHLTQSDDAPEHQGRLHHSLQGIENGSSTTKRARRNSTGQIAVGPPLANCSGMNLQSTGQTAAVGKGYLQTTTAHPQNSLAGECPWYLQNPGANSNPPLLPPPTAPLRQHKRPAPQPGGNPFPASHLPHIHQNQAHNNQPPQQQYHLMSGVPIIADLLKPNSIAIHPHQTYQSTTTATQQQLPSPKSPSQICPPGMMPGSGGVGSNSGSLLHPQPQQHSLMSTSLNSAHLSGHGHPSQAIASNLPPANSIGSLGMISSSSVGAAGSSSNLGVTPSLYIDNTGSAVAWPSGGGGGGTASLSPTAGGGGVVPLPPRKCEVKLNAMPWFHGSISRDEAEHLLQPREDGLFLVRESTNFPGDYTLCVCFQGKVEHYRVKYLDNKLTIDDEEYFENLGQLVQHYEKDADGLCTQLVKCLSKVGRQDFCINSKDFLDRGWVIPEADLQLRESIGKGEFGDVMLGILRNDRVAVKVLKDEGAAQKFLTEASVMTTLEHENLVKFIGLVFSSKHIYLVTEYMSKGSLVDYLRSRGRQHITRKDQINFACDTCSGMEYLEIKKVVHRDLAARNVLISESCIAKVADFGLAREECYNLDVGKLPIKWTAPEALKGGRFSNKSDMWSFGILLWEIYSFGRVPYPRIPLADVVKHVEVGYKMEAPEGCPSEIYEMMRQAWDLNPSRRPSFSDLKVKLLQLKSITT